MKKILVMLALTLSFLSAINLQTATKDELMCIKGIGDKKADMLIKYRKSNTLKSANDLLEIKGFGKGLVKNVEKNVKSVACGGKKSKRSSQSKKASNSEKASKSEKKHKNKKSEKRSEKKKSEKKKSSKKDKSNEKSEKKSDSEKKKSKKKVSDAE